MTFVNIENFLFAKIQTDLFNFILLLFEVMCILQIVTVSRLFNIFITVFANKRNMGHYSSHLNLLSYRQTYSHKVVNKMDPKQKNLVYVLC